MENQPVPAASGEEAYRAHVISSGSWGAACFTWIYLLAMRAWGHALLAFVGTLVFWPAVTILYGMYGKRIAWQTRQWRDFDDFLACQRKWTTWAVVVSVAAAVVMVLGIGAALVIPHFVKPASI